MLKKTIFAGFALLIAAFAFQPVGNADAKVRVHIGIGGGFYGDPFYYDRGYYYGRRYYEPRYRPVPRYRPRRVVRRISCRQARRIVRSNGFRKIRVIDCAGRQYDFRAKKRSRWYRIKMRSRNGQIFSVRRM